MIRLKHVLTLALLIPLVLSACGLISPDTTATSTVQGGNGTDVPFQTETPVAVATIRITPESLHGLKIQVWHALTGPAADVFTNQLARFNTLNEWGIVVFQSPQGDYVTLFDSVNSALESEQAPELVVALPEHALAWDDDNAVVDLSAYLYDPKYGLEVSASADVPDAFWAQDEVGGKRLGIPALRTARFLFYNQTWGRELGFDSPPENETEFREQACAANAFFRTDDVEQNDGYGGWIVDSDPLTVLSWMKAFGGGVVNNGAYRFATKANQSALKFLKGLYDENCAWISTEPTPYTPFARRFALFVTAGLAEVPNQNFAFEQEENTDEWTLIPFPGSDGTALVAYGPSYTILRSSPEEQLAAWLFIRFLFSAEAQAQWVEATGLLPLRDSSLASLTGYRNSHAQWEAAVTYLPQASIVPQLASWRMVRLALGDGVTHMFRVNLSGEQIPLVLRQMDALADELEAPAP